MEDNSVNASEHKGVNSVVENQEGVDALKDEPLDSKNEAEQALLNGLKTDESHVEDRPVVPWTALTDIESREKFCCN